VNRLLSTESYYVEMIAEALGALALSPKYQ
jgi:hypothetical protein